MKNPKSSKFFLAGFFAIISFYKVNAQRFSLVPVKELWVASCAPYKVVDSSGVKVDLPDDIKSTLECPDVLDLHKQSLIISVGNKLVWYNLATHLRTTLMSFYDDVDGISNICWSPNGNRLMLVIIDQEKKHGQKESCRIVVLDVDSNGKVLLKQKYDRAVAFVCGSSCGSEAGIDFKFENDSTVVYRMWDYDPQKEESYIWSSIRLK